MHTDKVFRTQVGSRRSHFYKFVLFLTNSSCHSLDVAVFLGAYNLNVKAERGAQQRDVDEICVHPEWKVDNDRYDADLAILVLSEIVEFTKYIRPICMPDDDPPIDNIGSIVGKMLFV